MLLLRPKRKLFQNATNKPTDAVMATNLGSRVVWASSETSEHGAYAADLGADVGLGVFVT
jgi:hypothetical protein